MSGKMIRDIQLEEVSDIQAPGGVGARVCHEACTGILLHEQLQYADIAFCSERWGNMLYGASPDTAAGVQMAVKGGRIIGLGCHCAQRNAMLSAIGYQGEVAALYVLRSYQGRGLGRRLMQGLALQLRQSGYTTMALWVVRENLSARGFYHRLGGKMLMDREIENADGSFVEVAYGWKDIDSLF